jgi:hypothetical protein
MSLFSIKGEKDKIEKIDFKLEKDLQKLTEDNLDVIFNNLEFIATEL